MSADRHVAYHHWTGAAALAEGRPWTGSTAVHEDSLVIDNPSDTVVFTDPYGDGSSTTFQLASWSGPEVSPGFAFTELVPSWNARTPPGTWLEVSVRVRVDGEWSRRYILGRWAEETDTIHRSSVPEQDDDVAAVDVDTLRARPGRSFTGWALGLRLYRRTTETPQVRLVGAMASALPGAAGATPASAPGPACGTTLDVPAFSQEIHRGEYPEYNGGGEAWCSPTATAMVLAYWQRVTGEPSYGPTRDEYAWVNPSYADPLVDFAAAGTYDWSYDGTGNWPFNTAFAGRYGHTAFVTRLRSLREAEEFVAAGVPLIASVSFSQAELPAAGYGTDGHLLVIAGFSTAGDVLANDPASHLRASNDEVRTVYPRADFERVWLQRSGGIVYVIAPPSHRLPACTTPDEPNW